MGQEVKKVWLLFDGRYKTDQDNAVCFEACETLKEAKKNAKEYGNDTVIVETEVHGKYLKNHKTIN